MADTTKPKAMEVDKNDEQKPIESQQAHLGVLEEDDEFEEFTVQEWKDEETDVSKFLEQSGAAGKGGASAQLWEDTWDDDDIEEDFSVQLREELAKATKSTEKANPDAMVS